MALLPSRNLQYNGDDRSEYKKKTVYMWQNVSFHCLEGLLSLEEKVFSEETSVRKTALKLHTEELGR